MLDRLVAGLLGALVGAAASWPTAILALAQRRARNRARMRRGLSPYKDEILTPLWGLGAIVGFVVGAALPSAWSLPARAVVGGLAWPVVQLTLSGAFMIVQTRDGHEDV